MMGFSSLDWLILLVVLLNVAGAIAQGFVYELFSFLGVILGYLIAAWEYPRVAAFYLHYVNSAWAADIAGFLTVFLAVLLLGSVAGKIGRRAIEGIGLRWIDHFLGGLFGFLKGVVVCTVVVMALAAFSPDEPVDSRLADCAIHAGHRSRADLGRTAGTATALHGRLEPAAHCTGAH